MGLSVRASLFYGYLQPQWDREIFLERNDPDFETPWSDIHTERFARCVGGMYGYDEHLGFFLAIEASLKQAEWDDVVELRIADLKVHEVWQSYLETAAQHFHLDLHGLRPSWYLTSLYF
jgi:hypothetical protein